MTPDPKGGPSVRPPTTLPISIPDDFMVWAGTDLHGQLRATERLLREAGLADGEGNWAAPPRTAFVVCGDIVDRGPASLQLLRRLVALGKDAAARDGMVVLLEGNHEIQALLSIEGDPVVAGAWMLFGAGALLESAGMTAEEFEDGTSPVDVARRLAILAPDLEDLLRSLAPYATWRDVLLVHAGPTPGTASLAAFAASVKRLWIRDAFYASPEPFPGSPAWRTYAGAGIGRVVFGHTSLETPALVHDGRGLNLDTARGGRVSLARLPASGSLAEARMISAPTEPRRAGDPSYTADDVRRWDALLPTHIDGLRAAARATGSR